jgi:hypothetical protein
MFPQFQHLLRSGLHNTATDGDCFFDALAKTLGHTKRHWRQVLADRLYKKGTFTLEQYTAYAYVWADIEVVYEAVRLIQRPFCVVQRESPNAVMLIRPDVPFTSMNTEDIVYLVYENGCHFTSFVNPITPPELLRRIRVLETVGMREEEPGCIVTHGNLRDLLQTKRQTRRRLRLRLRQTRKSI